MEKHKVIKNVTTIAGLVFTGILLKKIFVMGERIDKIHDNNQYIFEELIEINDHINKSNYEKGFYI